MKLATVKAEPDTMTLEKNVPLPDASGPRSELGKILRKMKVDESFTTNRQISSIYSLARYWDIEVAIRSLGDGVVRVWCVKRNKPTKGKP